MGEQESERAPAPPPPPAGVVSTAAHGWTEKLGKGSGRQEENLVLRN